MNKRFLTAAIALAAAFGLPAGLVFGRHAETLSGLNYVGQGSPVKARRQ